MNDEIYNLIWEADSNKLEVSTRNEYMEWINPAAEILLDHQVGASDSRDIDLALHPLFHSVKSEKLNGQTYVSYKNLLDNYLVNYRDPEDYTDQERQEDYDFLGHALDSKPLKIAFDYITNGLGKKVSPDEFLEQIWEIWFEPYTNYYGSRPTEYASGFEHIFVGEGKYQKGEGIARGEVSGYHDWYKFFIDENKGRVDFRGTKYGLQGLPEPRSPNVVTLQMIWNLMDTDGEVIAELYKPRGGFFVGISPECLMALGTVGFYESVQGLTIRDRRNVEIQGDMYNLVIYRDTRQDGSSGGHLRSFYPEYLGDDAQNSGSANGGVIVRPSPVNFSNDGDVVITRAMINPVGDDASGEWVELQNISNETISLTGWYLADKLDRPQPIGQQALEPNQVIRVDIERKSIGNMALGNSGGQVKLRSSSGLMIAAVSYGSTPESVTVEFREQEGSDENP